MKNKRVWKTRGVFLLRKEQNWKIHKIEKQKFENEKKKKRKKRRNRKKKEVHQKPSSKKREEICLERGRIFLKRWYKN